MKGRRLWTRSKNPRPSSTSVKPPQRVYRRPIEKAPLGRGRGLESVRKYQAGLQSFRSMRRIEARDELVSLGFRVGNPSAIGWHQPRIFQHPLLPVGVTPTTSRRIATRSLRRKMARSPSRAGGRRTRLQLTGRGRNHLPRRGIFSISRYRGVSRRSGHDGTLRPSRNLDLGSPRPTVPRPTSIACLKRRWS